MNARCLLALPLLAGMTIAQTPPTSGTLVRDIHTGPPAIALDSDPVLLAANGTTALFTAKDGVHGRELWITDGTRAGTRMLVDSIPGPDPGEFGGAVALPNGRFVVMASSPATGLEPHVYDPANPGLRLLADLTPGAEGSEPTSVVLWQGEAWFAARSPALGMEFWHTNGTVAGTLPGQELIAGPDSTEIDPDRIAVAGGKLYFLAGSPVGGFLAYFLWVKPARNTPAFSLRPHQFSLRYPRGRLAVDVGGKLLFTGEDLTSGIEPWITDGTVAGTQLLADLAPGLEDSYQQLLACDGQRAWFLGETNALGRELYVTDGTPAGTRLVADLNPGIHDALSYGSRGAILPGGDLLFGAFGGSAEGMELWRSDGTPAGTRLAADLVPGTFGSEPAEMLTLGANAYFRARSSDWRFALWRYDAASGATVQLTSSTRAGSNLGMRPLTALGSDLLFAGEDERFGLEPSRTDGTPGGTGLVRDIHEDPTGDSRIEALFRHRDLAFFGADDGVQGREPWVTNGTEPGTVPLGDLSPGIQWSNPTAMASLPAGLVFRCETGAARSHEVWITDGTPTGTRKLIGFSHVRWPAEISSFQDLGDFALFVTHIDGLTSLWRSDGTVAGTTAVDGWRDDTDLDIVLHSANAGWAFGAASRPSIGTELFASDGTSSGTQIVDLYAGTPGSFPFQFTPVADGAVFAVFEPVDGVELWFAGGRPFRTLRVTDSAPGPDGFRVLDTASMGATALVLASDPFQFGQRTFWRTDGTRAGTFPISTNVSPNAIDSANLLTAAGHSAWFWTQTMPGGPYELWITDGTPQGFRSVWTAPVGSFLFPDPEIAALGDGVDIAFTLTDPTHGRELWISDGTTAGTRLLTDITAGSGDSEPTGVTRLANRILFAARSPDAGMELHAIDHADLGAWVASPFGDGCGATVGSSGSPTLGDSFAVVAEFAQANAATAFLFSPTASWSPLAPSCLQHLVAPDTVGAATTDPTGTATLSFTVPVLPALVGDLLHFQAFAAVPGGPLFGTVAASPGLEVVVGR